MKPAKPRHPKYVMSSVRVKAADGRYLLLPHIEASRGLGRASGGMRTQSLGKAKVFTSETARSAAIKRWARHKVNKRGFRLGKRLVKRPPVIRAPLRAQYAVTPDKGIHYDPVMQQWFLTDTYNTRPISERWALIRLGYLPRATDRVVPQRIEPKKVKP